MAKAWRNEAARKINARRKAGSKEGSARMQKNERLFIAKVWPIKAAGNWLLAGLLERIGIYAPEPSYPAYTKAGKVAQSYGAGDTKAKEVDLANTDEGFIKSFLRKAKSFFTGSNAQPSLMG